ncbi:MAG: sensor protein KdpD [Methanoregula sp. PtaU1.Bin006]|nr:MAG: sensor protein KdpD [Methanoregula sp. PtaB.Bin085]OPY33583.1 MAG: sensor protein KdpD [Methanoregula sp. PtaU1.Bin006]
MWFPDIRTIFLMIFLINAFLTLMIFAYWKTQKTHDGFALWAVSLLFQSLAYLLFMLRGEVSDLLSIPVANVFSMLAMIMRVDAIRRFIWGRPIPAGYYSLLVPIFIIYWYYTYILDSIILRALVSTLCIAPVLIIAGYLALISVERENRIIRYLFAASLTIPAFILIVRLAAWFAIPEQYTLFSTDIFNTAFFVIAMIADILATGFFLMLNMVRSQKELRQTNEKLNLLSSITRHDIRNQLHALSAYLELSRQAVGKLDTATELIAREEQIVATITHQLNFTGDYQDMGIAAPVWQNVDDAVRTASAALQLRDVRIDIDRQDLEVWADPLLGKVFYNLIDNALKYGGGKLSVIRISSRETGSGLALVLEDDGAGISEGDRQHLFERGYGKNTGLGLFLSREILSITGITIRETGKTGGGARFEMTVPKGGYRFIKRET